MNSSTRFNGIYKSLFISGGAILAITLEYIHRLYTIDYQHATTGQIATGVAEVPYQYRLLIPQIGSLLTSFPGYFDLSFYTSLLSVFASFATLYCTYTMLRYFKIPRIAAYLLSPGSLLLAAGCLFVQLLDTHPLYYYPYDLAGMAFFTAGLMYLLTEQKRRFSIIFCLGTLNRETTLFLIFPYLRLSDYRHGRQALVHIASLALAWALIKYTLYQVFSNNIGRPVHLSFMDNLTYVWSLPIPVVLFLLFAAGFLYSVRQTIPKELRCLLMCLPPFLGVIAIAGFVLEARIFLELCPLLWVTAVVGYCEKHGYLEQGGSSEVLDTACAVTEASANSV